MFQEFKENVHEGSETYNKIRNEIYICEAEDQASTFNYPLEKIWSYSIAEQYVDAVTKYLNSSLNIQEKQFFKIHVKGPTRYIYGTKNYARLRHLENYGIKRFIAECFTYFYSYEDIPPSEQQIIEDVVESFENGPLELKCIDEALDLQK